MEQQTTTAPTDTGVPTGYDPGSAVSATPVAVDPDLAGTLLAGRYEVGTCIGRGAMGVVWTARDRRLGRTVAIKQLGPLPADGVGAAPSDAELSRARALREGRIAARVVHPRAIAVFDVLVEHGVPWLVMEYLPSRSLATVIAENGPLEPTEAARIGAQIAEALTAVHAAGIVHGDVKPGNVLIAEDGGAKLTDFGVSHAAWESSVATSDGTVAGTPGYLAPEVARGEQPTAASDVFSLGATLYAAVEGELICGRHGNALGALHAMAAGEFRAPRRARVLAAPLAALTEVDPGRRPTAGGVRRGLRRAERGLAPTGDTPPAATAGDGHVAVSTMPSAPAAGTAETTRSAVPAPTAPGGRDAARPGPGRRLVLAAAVAALVLVGGVGAALASSGGGTVPQAAPAPAPASRAPAATANPGVPGENTGGAGTSEADATSPAPDPADAPVTASDVRTTVTGYYGKLPGDVDGAWAQLSDQARSTSGGYGNFQKFWNGISSVQAGSVSVSGDTAHTTLQFVTDGGVRSSEPYTFRVARGGDGRLVVRSFQRGSQSA